MLLAGCSGGGAGTSPPSIADAATDASPVDASGDAPAASGGFGLIRVARNVDAEGKTQSHAFASFRGQERELATSCETHASGDCFFARCDFALIDGKPPPISGSEKDVGDVVLEVPSLAAPVTLRFEFGSYNAYLTSSRLFEGGDVLTARATGAEVSALGTLKVEAPSDLTVTSPTCSGTTCGAIERAEGLEVAWSGGGRGDAILTIAAETPGGAEVVRCAFAADAGKGTVPAEITSRLGAAERAGFSLVPAVESSASAGGWEVRFIVEAEGTAGDVVLE